MNLLILPLAAAAVVALSAAGLAQSRWKALRLAVLAAWLGPIPAYFCAVLAWPQPPALTRSPEGALRFLAEFLPSYFAVALPAFGPYCFLVALAGAWLIGRAGAWRPAAIAGICAAAAAPFVLVEGSIASGFGLCAAVAAGFWCLMLLAAGRRLFAPA